MNGSRENRLRPRSAAEHVRGAKCRREPRLAGTAGLRSRGVRVLSQHARHHNVLTILQQADLVTFNAWALDGYLKVFWRDAPLWQLWPQGLVLCALAAVLLAPSRTLARRWETA